MTIKNIIGAARWVRQKTESKFNVDLTEMDREDLEQSAAEGFCKALNKKPGNEFYAWKAANNQCLKAMLVDIFGKNPITVNLDESIITPELPNNQLKPFIDRQELTQLFLSKRKKKGDRGLKAAQRDAHICYLIMQGANNAGVAQELGIPEHDVRSYRSRIQKMLQDEN